MPKLVRRDYQFALSQVGNGVDDPDQNYPENYACGSRTYMDYCNKEVDALIASSPSNAIRTSASRSPGRSTASLRLTRCGESSTICAGTCWRPAVKNVTVMVNSIYNGWRMEEVWLQQ